MYPTVSRTNCSPSLRSCSSWQCWLRSLTVSAVWSPWLAAVVLGLAVGVQNPIVSCPAELQLRFTPEMRQEAVALKKGFVYFPFFTAKITVKDIQEDGVVMIESLYLFALASDEVAFGGPDGPEVVEKLNLIW